MRTAYEIYESFHLHLPHHAFPAPIIFRSANMQNVICIDFSKELRRGESYSTEGSFRASQVNLHKEVEYSVLYFVNYLMVFHMRNVMKTSVKYLSSYILRQPVRRTCEEPCKISSKKSCGTLYMMSRKLSCEVPCEISSEKP